MGWLVIALWLLGMIPAAFLLFGDMPKDWLFPAVATALWPIVIIVAMLATVLWAMALQFDTDDDPERDEAPEAETSDRVVSPAE